jgi:Chaperone of endosialidase
MYTLINFKTMTPRRRNSISTAVAGLLTVLVCFALSPTPNAFGVTPAPDGGYPGFNTAEGQDALFSLTTGIANTANGAFALYKNSTGNGNTANGFEALFSNTTGIQNTANGVQALLNNTTGDNNTANGLNALRNNTVGIDNTANGHSALQNNTRGIVNTANGRSALQSNTDGRNNTANGAFALFSNGIGQSNTANGAFALYENTTGSFNTANGLQALFHNTGSFNIALGTGAGTNLTTGNNNIDIGNVGVAAEANTIRIGKKETQTATFIAGISGKTASGGVAVYVNANGKLGTTVSSARFKEQIKPMDKASEAIHALKPVTFRYKQELDPEGIPQFGLVAEEVEKVNADLVARDGQGKVYTVRYEAVNAMLLNEFLKEHQKVQQLEATVAQQQRGMEVLTAQLKEQASQIQKVSAQLELSKSAPQMVGNNP